MKHYIMDWRFWAAVIVVSILATMIFRVTGLQKYVDKIESLGSTA